MKGATGWRSWSSLVMTATSTLKLLTSPTHMLTAYLRVSCPSRGIQIVENILLYPDRSDSKPLGCEWGKGCVQGESTLQSLFESFSYEVRWLPPWLNKVTRIWFNQTAVCRWHWCCMNSFCIALNRAFQILNNSMMSDVTDQPHDLTYLWP